VELTKGRGTHVLLDRQTSSVISPRNIHHYVSMSDQQSRPQLWRLGSSEEEKWQVYITSFCGRYDDWDMGSGTIYDPPGFDRYEPQCWKLDYRAEEELLRYKDVKWHHKRLPKTDGWATFDALAYLASRKASTHWMYRAVKLIQKALNAEPQFQYKEFVIPVDSETSNVELSVFVTNYETSRRL
jgi:hypothetical protein